MSRKLKKHSEVPVVIVEDHHEVVQHIYREIGSRYLPMQGLTLVHFDSHPDMLIPLNMPADTVFEKEQLLETLSIENWIVPAVYAGHINHVVWIKPPWCHQVCDGSSEFYVGKCLKTGTIRTTCSESYFLSETLFVPEDQLTNKQKLKFTVLTVQPTGWNDGNENTMSCDVDKQTTGKDVIKREQRRKDIKPDYRVSDCVKVNNTIVTDTGHLTDADVEYGSGDIDTLKVNRNTSNRMVDSCSFDGVKINCNAQQVGSESSREDKSEGCVEYSKICDNSEEKARKPSLDVDCVASVGNTEVPDKKGKRADDECVGSNKSSLKKTLVSQCQTSENETDIQRDVIYNPNLEAAECDSLASNKANISELESDGGSLPSALSIRKLCEVLQEQSVILDIDLDFFSTKNPFREMYGPEQYEILKELYKFQRPTSLLLEDIEKCSKNRQEQLNALQEAFASLENNPDATIVHSRSDLIHSLVSSLRARDPSSVALLHDAGCTCDDTELPHHVSSPAQITWLVDSVQDLLSYLPKPNMVTIARSSLDDYCPPDQVDSIQEQVLDILKQLFLEITVRIDYGTDEIEAESASL